MRRGLAVLIAAFVLLGGGAAGRAKKPKAVDFGSELAKAPASAKELPNPYAGQLEAILAGKKLFGRYCANCHGPDGRGGEDAPDLRSPVVQNVPPGVLFWFLRNGNLKGGMPSWSRLPDQQRWQLVSYIRTLGRGTTDERR